MGLCDLLRSSDRISNDRDREPPRLTDRSKSAHKRPNTSAPPFGSPQHAYRAGT